MDFSIKDANTKELEKMSDIVSEMIDEKFAIEEHQRIIQQKCEPHSYQIVYVSDHKIVRVCQLCEKERFSFYTNDQLKKLDRHKEDFVQPGSKLYEQIYGKTKK